VNGAYEKTTRMLSENLEILHKLAGALLERETLDSKDIDAIIENERKGGDSQEESAPEETEA
jgi:cell division protease FtsH